MLISLGISHKTASFAVRQKVAFAQENIQPALTDFLRYLKGASVAILSTCNRTEFYCSDVKADTIINWWKQYLGLESEELDPDLYCYMDDEVSASNDGSCLWLRFDDFRRTSNFRAA